jgi:hypothetical protein
MSFTSLHIATNIRHLLTLRRLAWRIETAAEQAERVVRFHIPSPR